MEKLSIKALAVKALHGNKHGNKMETSGFHDGNMRGTEKDIWKPPYTIIYSRILDDFLLIVDTDQDAEALHSQGVIDAIYTAGEIPELKGLPEVSLKAVHMVKKVFPGARLEGDKGRVKK